MHINTLGQLKTCCAQFDFLEENKGVSFREIFNGNNFKAIRNQFLAARQRSLSGWQKAFLLEQIFSVLDEVEEIYFAGGEPLLSEDHYLVLEEIIRRKRTNIKITYNTNLSQLSAHGRDVIDLWKKLDQVIVYPSIDSIGAQGEYIRSGFKWEQFETNFTKIKNYVGCLHSVLSTYNVYSIPDLIMWAHSKNAMLSIFPAYHPVEISASVLPLEVRRGAADRIQKLVSDNTFSDWQLAQLNTAVEFLINNHTRSISKNLSILTSHWINFRKLNLPKFFLNI